MKFAMNGSAIDSVRDAPPVWAGPSGEFDMVMLGVRCRVRLRVRGG
jgi:hypothetical protein